MSENVLPHGQYNYLPPHSLILDFTMTHDRFGRSHVFSHTWSPGSTDKVTHILSVSYGDYHLDDDLKNTVSPKILYYKKLYTDRPDPIVFLCVSVNTSDRFHDVTHLLISTRSFITLPPFIRSRHPPTLLAPSLVLFLLPKRN